MTIVHLKLGKITKRSDGRYQAGYRDVDGKRKFITCNSEQEVLKRFQALQPAQERSPEKKHGRSKADAGTKATAKAPAAYTAPTEDCIPLADYMLNWLEKFKKGKIRPSTYERYQFCLQLLCKDELAQMDIRAIRLEDVQEYVNRLEDMSASTIKKQKLLLSQVLEHAMLTEVIQRNPVQGVQMPPMTHNTKVVLPYEKDEQEKLAAAFTEEKNGRLRFRYGWGAVLILETGLRAGEALALEWGDIDEEKRTLKVTKNMIRVDGKNTVQRTTKTDSGKRTIPLNGRALEAIQRLKAQEVHGCPYVFATQTGKYLSYRNLLATMEKACEAAEVEHRGLHALRHSFASNLYARGVEVKIISKLLGHASVEITYNRYIHFFEGEIDDTLRQAVGA
ncbi:tyrosine-type recombinase/integrase [Bacillota bacterium Meth-B3]